MRIRPSTECEIGDALPNLIAELPRMLDTSRRPHAFVTAEHDECIEAVMMRAIRVTEAVIEWVLAGEEGNDSRLADLRSEIDDEMAEVVFFFQPHRTIGEEDVGAGACEAADRVVRVDPRVHARRRFELGPRRTQFRCDDVAIRTEGCEQSHICK